MSTMTHSMVAEQSKKTKTTLVAGAVTVAVMAAAFAFTPATHALGFDNVNLGSGISTQDGDESSSAGLRLASQDGLENLGLGTGVMNQDGDESQSAGLKLESTDDLENLGLGSNVQNNDGDEMQQAGLGVTSTDDFRT